MLECMYNGTFPIRNADHPSAPRLQSHLAIREVLNSKAAHLTGKTTAGQRCFSLTVGPKAMETPVKNRELAKSKEQYKDRELKDEEMRCTQII